MMEESSASAAAHVSQNRRALIYASFLLVQTVAQVLHASDTVENVAGTLMDSAAEAIGITFRRDG